MKIKVNEILKKYSYDLDKIVGVDPIDFDKLYLLDNGILSEIDSQNIEKEHLISSYIPNKNVITYEFKLQKNLLDKIEIEDYIETKCYEELGLDEAEEYIFKHKAIDLLADEKYLTVEVVVISKKEIEEYYSPLVKKFGYLDYLAYPGYVYSVLYQEKILEPQNDLFIYFTKDEIFITLYSEGQFLQTYVIPEGLSNIYDELTSSITIKNFSFEIFVKLLTKKGLDLSNYNDKEAILFNELSEIMSNKFLIISNQLHTIIRKFSLTTIDRIYMSTFSGNIPGISEFANMYLGVESNDLRFDMEYNPNNIKIDQILFLSMLYARAAYKNENQIDNFTIYYRPPTFIYRQSGQFILVIIVSFILSLLYPLYQFINTLILESDNNILQQKFDNLTQINRKLLADNKKYLKILNDKKKEKQDLVSFIKNRENIINSIYLEKTTYIPKSLLLSNLSKYLYMNKVYLNKINFSEENKTLSLNVYAKEDKYITTFIDNIIKDEHLIINTPGYRKKQNFYIADIIIKVK